MEPTKSDIVTLSKNKYDQLIDEFQKIKAQNSLLKKAVGEDKVKIQLLVDQTTEQENLFKEKTDENKQLSFNNKRLETRVAQLVFDLEEKDKEKTQKSFLTSIFSQGGPNSGISGAPFMISQGEGASLKQLKQDLEVTQEELKSKIAENEQLHIALFELKSVQEEEKKKNTATTTNYEATIAELKKENESLLNSLETNTEKWEKKKVKYQKAVHHYKKQLKQTETQLAEMSSLAKHLQVQVGLSSIVLNKKFPFEFQRPLSSALQALQIPLFEKQQIQKKFECFQGLRSFFQRLNRSLEVLYASAFEKIAMTCNHSPRFTLKHVHALLQDRQWFSFSDRKLMQFREKEKEKEKQQENQEILSSSLPAGSGIGFLKSKDENISNLSNNKSKSKEMMTSLNVYHKVTEELIAAFDKSIEKVNYELKVYEKAIFNPSKEQAQVSGKEKHKSISALQSGEDEEKFDSAVFQELADAIQGWLAFHARALVYVIVSAQDKKCRIVAEQAQPQNNSPATPNSVNSNTNNAKVEEFLSVEDVEQPDISSQRGKNEEDEEEEQENEEEEEEQDEEEENEEQDQIEEEDEEDHAQIQKKSHHIRKSAGQHKKSKTKKKTSKEETLFFKEIIMQNSQLTLSYKHLIKVLHWLHKTINKVFGSFKNNPQAAADEDDDIDVSSEQAFDLIKEIFDELLESVKQFQLSFIEEIQREQNHLFTSPSIKSINLNIENSLAQMVSIIGLVLQEFSNYFEFESESRLFKSGKTQTKAIEGTQSNSSQNNNNSNISGVGNNSLMVSSTNSSNFAKKSAQNNNNLLQNVKNKLHMFKNNEAFYYSSLNFDSRTKLFGQTEKFMKEMANTQFQDESKFENISFEESCQNKLHVIELKRELSQLQANYQKISQVHLKLKQQNEDIVSILENFEFKMHGLLQTLNMFFNYQTKNENSHFDVEAYNDLLEYLTQKEAKWVSRTTTTKEKQKKSETSDSNANNNEEIEELEEDRTVARFETKKMGCFFTLEKLEDLLQFLTTQYNEILKRLGNSLEIFEKQQKEHEIQLMALQNESVQQMQQQHQHNNPENNLNSEQQSLAIEKKSNNPDAKEVIAITNPNNKEFTIKFVNPFPNDQPQQAGPEDETIHARLPTPEEFLKYNSRIFDRENQIRDRFKQQISYLHQQLSICDKKSVEYRVDWEKAVLELDGACARETQLNSQIARLQKTQQSLSQEMESMKMRYENQILILSDKYKELVTNVAADRERKKQTDGKWFAW